MLAHVDPLEAKIRKWRPRAVCVVGKGIWDAIFERRTGRKVGREFRFGWQAIRMGEGGWSGARVFVTPSTSGRVAAYSREFQEVLWRQLGDWVRAERGDVKAEREESKESLEVGSKHEEIA